MSVLRAIGCAIDRFLAPDESYKLDPVYIHFISFSEGDKVRYMGNEATVLQTDGGTFWNSENEIPVLYLAYTDKTGRVHREHLYPRDVYGLVTK